MYQLIFRGECQPGTDVQTARNNARTLFKASVEQVDRMFSGRPVVIRNRLEEDQAEKYRAVLARHGMVAYVEPMAPDAPAPSPSAQQSEPRAKAQEPKARPQTPAAGGPGPRLEPGDRLPVAGERADEVLAGSSLGLDPVGTRLADEKEEPQPMFEHLDEWTVAPAGTDLGVERDLPPPVVPDVSHLSLEDAPESGKR
ncbi:hypothetical protein [Marinobacter sp.]|uniref:hypothetical protein n=1 Tax=Marinobacter sp. TaxID=50741 RepID=UPI003562EE2E